ncbi:MAG: exodeoxyribonuclease VII large subunit [Anaerovoracaceae bacterium]|nr:exodeoxyribonuclease VII large subunit [Anaerovoracaceae bacterium]
MAAKPIKVSQLNSYIKRVLQTDPLLGNISVTGEISNLKHHSSGHVYFSLKDETSRINCFLAADNARHIRYELSEGMEIIVNGYIYLYERGGSYSINVRDIEVSGAGALSTAFENLKAKLLSEGLFDEAHKKPLPFFPENIAVVTSDTGAAVRDIVKIIKARNNIVNVYICPVLVQGPNAAPDISSMIDELNETMPQLDLIITGRGGGSAEELWAFNEEIVARSIYNSKIPVISAVGHETDFTIADFAADMRAETPTAAAVMAVPDTAQLITYCNDTADMLDTGIDGYIRMKQMYLDSMDKSSLTLWIENLIQLYSMRLDSLYTEMTGCADTVISENINHIGKLRETLENLNPQRIMAMGYFAVSDKNGRLLSSAKDFNKDDRITITAADGSAEAAVISVRRNS